MTTHQRADALLGFLVRIFCAGAFTFVSLGYLLPFGIALVRGHRNVLAILWLNLLLGWTLIGWLWAFIWAWTSPR
ncbi:hypothetical protein T2_00049 [Ralstonia phage Elie]|uniref:Superinfection immunity protein n=4 Tax=Bakolyvirus TaxID=2843355 RepID=A0A7G5BBS8_9CAUD|nr:immunity to superinfection [Ralstonia phage Adzire]YP_010052759.1 immunity to superinfection [Ralstonia phage Bakoly]YP_010077736.1 immunity to superinfection [Ralstonia phage Simangalove]QMV32994.1 hypothetical protein T2_00049 [Ralstonia phage Elie]QMV33560.1 hypothetical protein 30B_00053 [Ralstonia phage Jenny]QMV33648.1 hypothetical protein S3_00004 [Ralstonia phage Sarlave]QMV32366.1 hypothetical protein S1_00049 [Ralstonia phage Adzire]QMV32583.1 hypothetical protein 2B_00010 [Rals